MKLESKLFTAKPTGEFSVDLPANATILEWDVFGGFVRVTYELHEVQRESTPEWDR